MQSLWKQTAALIDCVLISNQWETMQTHSAPCTLCYSVHQSPAAKGFILQLPSFIVLKLLYCINYIIFSVCVCACQSVGRHVLYMHARAAVNTRMKRNETDKSIRRPMGFGLYTTRSTH